MAENINNMGWILGGGSILLLILIFNPSIVGVSAGAIGLGDAQNVWDGISMPFKVGAFFVLLIFFITNALSNK